MPVTSTVPTVAPVSPFTPVIDVTDGRMRQAVEDHRVRRDDHRRVGLVDRQVLSNVRRGKVVVVTGLMRRDGGAAVRDNVDVPHAGIFIDAGIASGGEGYRLRAMLHGR